MNHWVKLRVRDATILDGCNEGGRALLAEPYEILTCVARGCEKCQLRLDPPEVSSNLHPDCLSLSFFIGSHSYFRSFLILQTTIKVYAKCLRSDIEYKTLGITCQTTCREVVTTLLKKFRMRHRDPNLFYLTMEVTVRTAGIRTILPLDEEARPAVLQSCHPRGDSRFALQTRTGGLVKIFDGDVVPGSRYKSLLVSERTTADEIIRILLDCYNSCERVERFSLYEVCEEQEYRRKLHPDDCPLQVQRTWSGDVGFHFRIGKNPRYGRTKARIY